MWEDLGPGPVDHFVVTFFRSGGCTGPAGDAIYERTIHSWSEWPYNDAMQEYTATFAPVLMDAGETYWVSVQAVMDIETNGVWGWYSSELQLCPAMGRAPIPYGINDWTPVYPGIFPDYDWLVARAFCLYTDGAVPVQTESWGAVKSLYR